MTTEYFDQELRAIKDQGIRAFARYCLENAPPYFWVVPSSSTGKYHPPHSNGKGGLVRHTKAVCVFAETFIRAYDLKGEDADVVRAACLLHDIVKYGVGEMKKFTTKNHDYEGACYVYQLGQKFRSEGSELAPETIRAICSGISWHMGRWHSNKNHKDFPCEFSYIEQVVHLADMMAANKDVDLISLQQASAAVG